MPEELSLSHIPVAGVRVLGLHVIGSHIWGMNHEHSDLDSMAIVAEPADSILDGTAKLQTASLFRSETDHGWPVDIHVHEARRTAEFLERGNVNFLVGVASPIQAHTTPEMEDLRRLLIENPSANCYDSIHGMALHNVARYLGIPRRKWDSTIKKELILKPLPERRCAKFLAYLEFGITLLETGKMRFRKPDRFEWTTDGVLAAVLELERAKANTSLPERPPERLYRDWLLRVRAGN